MLVPREEAKCLIVVSVFVGGRLIPEGPCCAPGGSHLEVHIVLVIVRTKTERILSDS
jgi:hypothetical protein